MPHDNVTFEFDERTINSPLVALVWHTRSEGAGTFISQAVSNWEIVFEQREGRVRAVVRGPETRATRADVPADTVFLGITFAPGAFVPALPPQQVVDGGVVLPEAAAGRFWLGSRAWQTPDFENADTFVAQLVRRGLLIRDPLVAAALRGERVERTPRTLQRRFRQTTGLTQGLLFQIERARQAAALLEQGTPILDTVELAGFADQPHLTRALRRFTGRTPGEILGGSAAP